MNETSDKFPKNRLRNTLGKIFEEYPPYFQEYLTRYEQDPTSRVFAPLAEAYRKMGRLEDAIQVCRNGLSHHPEFHSGRVALAKCLMERGDATSAMVELERVLRVAPDNLLAQKLMGDAATELGRSEEALHAYKMALLLAPGDVSLNEKVRNLEKGLPITPAVRQPKDHSDVRGIEDGEIEDRDIPDMLRESRPVPEHLTVSPIDAILGDFEDETEDLDPERAAIMNALIGDTDPDMDEGFRVGNLKNIFEDAPKKKKEITTATLADIYFSQGQYERALRILDKLPQTADVQEKCRQCKLHLGVDAEQLKRAKQIDVLKKVIEKTKNQPSKSV